MLDFDTSQITVEIEEVDGYTVLAVVETPAGRIRLIGDVSLTDRVLIVRRAHIGGLHPGARGRRGLNIVGRKLLRN